MSRYINAERLRAEIKRRKEEYKEDRYMSDYRGQIAYYKDEIYDDLLSIIDSLQQEQPEMEEEIEDYWKAQGPMSHAEYDRLAKCARHFYGLGLNARKEE